MTSPCPRCRTTLRRDTASNIEQCPQCHGAFLDMAVLQALVREARAQAPCEYDKPPLHLEEAVVYLPCPKCGEPMNRNNYGGGSGVLVDVCTRDGIWFDEGELAQALAFAASGELAKYERSAEQRRQDQKRRDEFYAWLERVTPSKFISIS